MALNIAMHTRSGDGWSKIERFNLGWKGLQFAAVTKTYSGHKSLTTVAAATTAAEAHQKDMQKAVNLVATAEKSDGFVSLPKLRLFLFHSPQFGGCTIEKIFPVDWLDIHNKK